MVSVLNFKDNERRDERREKGTGDEKWDRETKSTSINTQ